MTISVGTRSGELSDFSLLFKYMISWASRVANDNASCVSIPIYLSTALSHPQTLVLLLHNNTLQKPNHPPTIETTPQHLLIINRHVQFQAWQMG